MKNRLLLCVLCVVVSSAMALTMWAQGQGSGSLDGTVTDQSGAVIPGVKVVVQNLGTNAIRELLTDSSGHYRADILPPGRYSVTASHTGFADGKIAQVNVQVGSLATGDIRMQVAGTQQTVEVSAQAPITDPERIQVASTIGEHAIETLPINGRRWSNFVLLTPGVTPDGPYGLVSYRGISGLYNNNSIDGADDNQAFFSEANGRTRLPYAISEAAIKEFQVGLSNYSAEFGRAAGGTVNAVTKSGTNEFHGEGFYFLRDQAFLSMDPFIKARGFPKPPERRQQFGGSVGGPIIKDKLFFFGNVDIQRRNFPITALPNAPFSSVSCTAPGCASTLNFLNSLVGTYPRQGNNYIFLTKVDWLINQNNTLTAEYNFHKWHSPNGIQTASTVSVAQSGNGSDDVRTDLLTVRLTSVLTSNTVNEFRFQFGRDFEYELANAPGPAVYFTNGLSFGMPGYLPRPAYPDEKKLQFTDNYSFIRGNHSFKTGFDIVDYRDLLINLYNGGGSYSYYSLNSLAMDCPAQASGCVPVNTGATTGKHYGNYQQAFDLTGQNGRISFTNPDYGFYFQDNWRARANLMLYFGLRYDLQHLPEPSNGNPAVPLTQHINQDTNNWGPRFGFSWDVTGSHKTVVRGGYGIYYGLTSNSAVSSALTNNGLVQASYYFSPSTPGSPTFPNVATAPPTTSGSLTFNFFSPDFVRPLIHSADLAIEHEISPGFTVTGSYLFSRGLHLPTFIDENLPSPTGTVTYVLPNGTPAASFPLYLGPRPNPKVSSLLEELSTINSLYNAFVLQVNKNFSHGIQFQSNFTLAKAIDDGQNSTTFFGYGSAYDPNNYHLEKGLSSFDVRKRWVTSFLVAPSINRFTDNSGARALFNNWQFSGILTFQDGHPLTPRISGSGPYGVTSSYTTNGSGQNGRVPFEAPGSFTSSGQTTVDIRFQRSFKVTEKSQFQVLWEGFNIFNHVNYTGFNTTQYYIAKSSLSGTNATINLGSASSFLTPYADSSFFIGPREFQLGLKFIW